jgi:small-conductance mechanosensitive channel
MLAILLTICFLIMGVNTQKLLVAFSSILLPSVFVFGNAARSTFESLIFLFIMHPFDVGDRIMVDNVSLVVEV